MKPPQRKKQQSYDEKCFELAQYFTNENVYGLAQAIQDAIEDWLAAENKGEPS